MGTLSWFIYEWIIVSRMELTDFREKYGSNGGPPGTPWGGAQGVYVVSPACPTQFWEGEQCGNNVPRNVKIGKASGENGFMNANGKGRLRHYRTYWPNGVTVHAVLVTPSFDRTVHTVKDEAMNRETTLRRIFKTLGLVGFGSDGRGGDNGTRHLGSEWIHLTPSQIMNYLIAAGPYRHTNDKLYGCTKNKCERVDVVKVSRNVTRLNNVVESLKYVLRDERNQGKKLGIRGRPVVLPRTIINAAKNKSHPLHIYSDLLVSNVNKEMNLAQRRLANRKKREVNAAEAKIAGERLTRVQRQVKRKRLNAKRKGEPRNIAAIRPTYGTNVAMKLRAAVTQPGVRKPIERFIAEPAHQAAVRQAGVGLARTTKKRGRGAGAVAAERAKKPPKVNQDALNTIKRHPNHRQRYNFEKKAVARRLYANLAGNQPSSDVPESPPSPVARTNSCPLRGTVLYEYPNYTYFDVTGDGRCYFYAVIKALGDPLHRGMGRKSNTNRFVTAENYFNPARQIYWKRRLKNAAFHDPIDVLYDSVRMGLALRDRGILYVAKLVRTLRDFSQVHAYMLDPMAQIRQSVSDGIYIITNDGSIRLIPELSARYRKNQDPEKTAAFNMAFREGRVVTFVWRNIPRLPTHYEVIIPKR